MGFGALPADVAGGNFERSRRLGEGHTHTLLWLLSSDSRLSSKVIALLGDHRTEAFVSVASLWELAIKVSLGKLELAVPFKELFPSQLERNKLELLPVEIRHLQRLSALPFHHRDPFDRLLIAQAIEESMVILGVDGIFESYPVATIW